VFHQAQVIQAGNVVVGHLECLLEKIDSFVILLGILICQTFAVVELGIVRHEFDGIVEIFMRELYFLKSEVCVAAIEEGPCIIGVQVQSFVVFCQAFIIHFVVV
jgi:hypothetical protein